jgi:CheY-like chemotaxis protein
MGKVLILNPGSSEPWLVDLLRRGAEVRVISSVTDALGVLEKEHFDWILSPATEIVDKQDIAASPLLSAVLDTINQGVCIVNASGQIIWRNARFNQLPEEIWKRICDRFFKQEDLNRIDISHRLRSLSLHAGQDEYFETTVTPMCDPKQGDTCFVVVVSDSTRSRRLQQKMDAIDNAGRELVRMDIDRLAKMEMPQRLELLEQKILRFTRELLNFDNFCIRVLHKNTNKLELALCAGLPVEAQQLDIYCSTENSGITGYVAATGRSYICPDVRTDKRYLRGIDDARSSLTVPLWLHDHVIGVFNIESIGVSSFSEDDRQFAEIFGRYIALALHILDVLVVERHTTTGRLADNVSSEIAGPLGDILADASALMEDYIGHDDLRHRLQGIIDNVATIKKSVKQVAKPEGGILGSRPKTTEADPLLAERSILVIDDEEVIRQTVQDVLTKHGCQVETAREGSEAMAMIHQRKYDLVLSDIRMPGFSGYEIFRAVKEQDAQCPVIFMTGFGYDPNHSIIRAHPEGLSAVLYKPFKVAELLDHVRAAVPDPDKKTG